MARTRKPTSTKPVATPKRSVLKRLVNGTQDEDIALMPRAPLRRPVPSRPSRFVRAG